MKKIENRRAQQRKINIQADGAKEHQISYGQARGTPINGAVAEGTPLEMPNPGKVPRDFQFEVREINVDGTPIIDFSNESTSTNSSEDDDKFARYFDEQKIKARPNTAYFTCSDFHQLSVPNGQPLDPNSPLFISLLLPSSSMGASVPLLANGDSSDAVVEINCQVVDINVLPSGQIAAPIQVMS